MKNSFSCASVLLSWAIASTAFSNDLAGAINANSKVVAIYSAARQILTGPRTAEIPLLSVVTVNCDSHAVEFGSELLNTCEFEARAMVGWYADPTLTLTVVGFVKNGQNLDRPIADSDLKITSLNIGTPLRTGLE